MYTRRKALTTFASAGAAFATTQVFGSPSAASTGKPLKLGILTDMSGPNKDQSGSSLACARQAIQDFDASGRGLDVEVLIADHQNKADVAAGIAQEWFDREGVDCLVDVSTSGTAMAVNSIVRDRNKVMMVVGAGTSNLTGEACSPNTIHWSYDTYMLAAASGNAVIGQGGKKWFFLAADYNFGHQMVADATEIVTKAGGEVVGSIFYPFLTTTDFSSYLLQAQASGADVLALAQSGSDTFNTIKQIREFGINQTMKPVSMLMFSTDLRKLGLDVAHGQLLSETFYWDLNNRTRSFMERVKSKTPDNWPNMVTAGIYSDTLHYLKAVTDMGVEAARADGRAAVERMKAMPTDDDIYGKGWIREDGRKMHSAYLFEAKSPEESTSSWDVMKVVAEIPAEKAFRPLSESVCSLVKS